jgi:hypothetical protein
MGLAIGNAALTLLAKDKLGKVADAFRVKPDDLKNLMQVLQSDQPHNRPTLASDMDSLMWVLGTHLQSDGLRGDQFAKLVGRFAPSVRVEDTTKNYQLLKMMFPELKDQKDQTGSSVTREKLLELFRSTGLLRWGCVQATRQAVAPALPLYDPDIDSAVMVITAKANADDTLDKNKTLIFGVHVKFDKAFNNEPLVINKLIFEDRRRDALLSANPKCVSGASDTKPVSGTPDTKPKA